MNKIFSIILGISFSGFGLGILLHPKFYDSKHDYYYDFSEIKLPLGSILIVIGVLFILLGFGKKSKENETKVLICPTCNEPFYNIDVPDRRCPNCGGGLEDLNGFYERHPELKSRNKQGRDI